MSTPIKQVAAPELYNQENESPNVVRVNIGTPAPVSQMATPTSVDLAAAGRRISVPNLEDTVHVSSGLNSPPACDESNDASSEDPMQCELETLREQLQQALDDKAELIEESLLDKERIKDQRETIELLTKRIREFEMSRAPLAGPVRSRSATQLASNQQIKQLGEDNIQLAREVDRLIAERDRLEKKLIDLKIKFANGYLTRQNSGASTDEDDNETGIFSTLSVDERLRRKKGRKILGASASKSTVFSAARSWFSRSKPANRSPTKAKSGKPNEASVGIAV